MRFLTCFLCLAAIAGAEVREHPGGKVLPHEKYIHVVSEKASPVERLYIESKDGLYIAAALRKPPGGGPFPALVYFHGAPGGRGMEKLVTWSRGDHGGPLWERFLQEGFVVVVADYRNSPRSSWLGAGDPDQVGMADDGVSVVEHVRSLPYVDPKRITVYGVSLGGNVVSHLISRTTVHAAIFGAPYVGPFLGAQLKPEAKNAPREDWYKYLTIDEELTRRNIAPIQTPIMILVGTKDRLIHMDRQFHDLLEAAGKSVRLEIFNNGYHDFVAGPQGHEGRDEPLLDATLEALAMSVEFARKGK
ncbi:MAG: prolyl oligopeptidase family serine peptidase [bacterium]|nr:prolyl oligopeptidase family serine peptidase [bacterium]